MTQYYGTKQIIGTPMTRKAYNDYRGWTVPSDENPDDEGYLVEYTDGDRSNHPAHAGYISWSPKDVFEGSYQPSGTWSFGHALAAIKAGALVARSGWNGKGMFVFLVNGSTFTVNREPLLSILGEGSVVNYLPHVDMKTVDGTIVPWLVSQSDLLANDWGIVPTA